MARGFAGNAAYANADEPGQITQPFELRIGMRSIWISCALAILLVGTFVPRVRGDITAAQVEESIRLAVQFLKSQQLANGRWDPYGEEVGGVTSLCTLAMLKSGLTEEDPAVRKALNALRAIEPKRTYSVSLQTMVFCHADPDKHRPFIRRNVNWLERNMFRYNSPAGPAGAWQYTGLSNSFDNSNTQFALLALYEAEQVGVKLDDDTWARILNHWRSMQHPNGAWSYNTQATTPTGAMTCAGIASMVIAAGRASQRRATVNGRRIRCCGQSQDNQDLERIERGMRWLARSFSVRVNPGDEGGLLYYLYGVERVGRLTGQRFIGTHDWYREGAEYLVAMQRRRTTGDWVGSGLGEKTPIIGTSLALLFLSKGRRPVLIAKLKYGDRAEWDYHTSGVPNLTRHVEKAWRRELTWQTTELRAATVEQLLESPILFLTGSETLTFNREDVEKLRKYVLQGGFIFAEARDGHGCDGTAFDQSFRRLAKELFPDSQLRVLPPEHPVWYAEGRVDSNYLRPLLGIDACCRTSIVYCPKNLSCFWELSDPRGSDKFDKNVQAEINACVQIGRNVVAYATNRVLKDKLERPSIVVDDPNQPKTDRGVLTIAKLRHSGGSDDAPRAVPNLLRYVQAEMRTRVRVENRLVTPTDPRLYEYPVLYMQGRFSFQFREEDRQALRQYLQHGGILFADSICANPQFAESLRREVEAMFPGQSLTRIAPDHSLFSTDYGGFDLSQVTLNDPQLRVANQGIASRRVKISPLLEGLEIEGRLAVVFSPYDLSCALENHNAPECKGYTKEDALRIGLNVLLFALQQ